MSSLGCQSRGAEYPEMDTPLTIAPAEGQAATAKQRTLPTATRPGTLYRRDVLAVVEAGLGRFLQKLDVDASLDGGVFQGFRILRLVPDDYWRGVDLRPGDIVTKVNGLTIERPPQAHQAFASLKTADQLVVSYTRGGQARELIYRIVESAPKQPKAQQAALAPTSGR